MIQWLSEHHCGQKKVNYRLREWIFARQRYWGEPIPIVHLDNGDTVALSDDQLPLLLPDLKRLQSVKTGASAAGESPDWVNVEVNGVKATAKRARCRAVPAAAGISCVTSIRTMRRNWLIRSC